ncbi:hypothetical protein N7492_008105 [Penicillium capsulatum]|uniref:UTP23 sensor motif region domain-containing protein n=1 Tax=Penicillium capsulatum TaxID=69766 RepID=A0A9W9HR50_9EURO|nr:hypothetical protein N7492_008105 [Penicillium capsulatum]
MRAKRSKKYRKLMHQYELAFGFREPYQVLVDSNFLRAVSSFKMELIPALERTLQGKVKPCPARSLRLWLRSLQILRLANPTGPFIFPLPQKFPSVTALTTKILRQSMRLTVSSLSLSPTPDAKKNKEHYTLATADPPAAKKTDKNDSSQQRKRKRDEEREEERAMRRAKSLRIRARSIPGVPIIYVKRSVMVLEPMSTPSEAIRDGVELSKLRAGLDAEPSLGKRKREAPAEGVAAPEKKKISGLKKAKGPNPLSMKKSKKKAEPSGPSNPSKTEKSQLDTTGPKDVTADAAEHQEVDEAGAAKTKRRRRHHRGGAREGNEDAAPSAESGHAVEVDA